VNATNRRKHLDRMLILGCRHSEAVLAEYVERSNAHRPHRSLSQRPPARSEATLPTIGAADAARLRRADHLGGLIHECRMIT
jgi:putative transposase